MEGFQALIGLAPWTIIFTLLNLILTMYVVKRFFFERMEQVLEKRQEIAGEKIREAEGVREEAFALKTRYERDIAGARDRANEILARANKTASLRREEMMKETEAQIRLMREQEEKAIARERKLAEEEMKKEVGALAMLIAARVIEREIKEKDHEKLIHDFIRNVGEGA